MLNPFHGLAVATLKQQVEIFGSETISLDSLWRAAGRPTGKDPRTWTALASPVVRGLDDYRAQLARVAGCPREDRPLVWQWDAHDGDPWRTGDLMTAGLIAQLYADYLDADHEVADAR